MIDERKEVVVAGFSDAFYGRPEDDDRVYFDTRTAAWLLKQEHILECLMKCGVHNFPEWDTAMELHKEEWKK